MSRITIWPKREVPGWDGTGPVPVVFPSVPVSEALLAEYETDAHFAPYHIEGEDAIPRFNKGPVWATFPIKFTLIAVDLEPKGHVPPTPEWCDRLVAEADRLGCAYYFTRGGGRFLWLAPPGTTAREIVGLMRAAAALVRDIEVDLTVFQPQRCFRVPFGTRDGVPQRLAHGRLDAIPMWTGAALGLPAPAPASPLARFRAALGLPPVEPAHSGAPPPPAPAPIGLPGTASFAAAIDAAKVPLDSIRRAPEGSRTDYLLRVAGKIAGFGGDLSTLHQINEARCKPPLPANEVDVLIRSATVKWWKAPPVPPGTPPDDIEPLALGDDVDVAARVVARLRARGPVVIDRGALWTYEEDSGVWEAWNDGRLLAEVHRWSGHPVNQGLDKDGLPRPTKPLKLSAAAAANIRRAILEVEGARTGFFDGAPRGVALADRFCGLHEDAPHAPENRATMAYPWAWTDEPPAAFLAFLAEVVDPEVIPLLQEFIGAMILGASPLYQRALMLVGTGANGKSVFSDVVRSLFPKGSVTSINPQDWKGDYERARLAKARANIVTETPEVEIMESGAVKAIIAGDSTSARQIYGTPFDFVPFCGHVFSANALPGVKDLSPGFWRRWAVVPFTRTIPPERQDPHLAERLRAEGPQIVCWAIQGARRLAARKGYEIPAVCVQAAGEWRDNADLVACFLAEDPKTSAGPQWEEGAAPLYSRFVAWCQHNGHGKLSNRVFSARLLSRGGVTRVHRRDGWYYVGGLSVVAE